MRAFRTGLLAVVAALGVLDASDSCAAEQGFYVGFLYGDASREYDVQAFDALAVELYDFLDHVSAQRGFTQEADSEAYGFLVGYRLTQHIAFEGGYTYLGKQSYRETSAGVFQPDDPSRPAIPETINVSLTTKLNGFALSALGILPLSYSFELYARAGLFVGSHTLDWYANDGIAAYKNNVNESSTDWLAGAGISWSLAEIYAIRAEFQRIFAAGAKEFGESDVDLVSIGITVAF